MSERNSLTQSEEQNIPSKANEERDPEHNANDGAASATESNSNEDKKNTSSSLTVLATTAATIGAFIGAGPISILAIAAATMIAGGLANKAMQAQEKNNASAANPALDAAPPQPSTAALLSKFSFFRKPTVIKKSKI